MKVQAFIILFLSLLSPIAGNPNGNNIVKQISGYVMDKFDSPLSDVEVLIINKTERAKTDSNGQFLFNGNYQVGDRIMLLFRKTGYVSEKQTFTVRQNSTGNYALEKEVMLRKQMQVGFDFFIKDKNSGALLGDVLIKVSGATYKTDEFGHTFAVITDESILRGELLANIAFKKMGYKDVMLRKAFTIAESTLTIELEREAPSPPTPPTFQVDSSYATDMITGERHSIRAANNLIWMTQNLDAPTNESIYYKNDPSNQSHGRLYHWQDAQKACPEGWRLPTKGEFDALISSYGGQKEAYRKIATSPNIFGGKQEVIVVGQSGTVPKFSSIGKHAFFWTSSESGADKAYYFFLNGNRELAGTAANLKLEKCSCICVLKQEAKY
jgi:uncharacterized protein (TIGR02145 family)